MAAQSFDGGLFLPGTYPKATYRGLLYLSLDSELIWSPKGEEFPQAGSWVWCDPEAKRLTNYLGSLWRSGFIPILYSQRDCSTALAKEVLRELEPQPPTFLGLSLAKIHHFILEETDNSSNGPLGSIGIHFVKPEILAVYHLGPSPIGRTLSHAEFIPEPVLEWKGLLILVGQPGSGKSTFAARLAEKGWLVIGESQANSLQRLNGPGRLGLIRQGVKGIVIDSPNPSPEHRAPFITLAAELGLDYRFGWVARPGWANDRQSRLRAGDEVLRAYTTRFVPPEPGKTIRLI